MDRIAEAATPDSPGREPMLSRPSPKAARRGRAAPSPKGRAAAALEEHALYWTVWCTNWDSASGDAVEDACGVAAALQSYNQATAEVVCRVIRRSASVLRRIFGGHRRLTFEIGREGSRVLFVGITQEGPLGDPDELRRYGRATKLIDKIGREAHADDHEPWRVDERLYHWWRFWWD